MCMKLNSGEGCPIFINLRRFIIYIYMNKKSCYTLSLVCFYIEYTYTMMLLMGMWISLTKNPIKPIMQKPIAVAMAIFWNSVNKIKLIIIDK